jgi:hypothetical protein
MSYDVTVKPNVAWEAGWKSIDADTSIILLSIIEGRNPYRMGSLSRQIQHRIVVRAIKIRHYAGHFFLYTESVRTIPRTNMPQSIAHKSP